MDVQNTSTVFVVPNVSGESYLIEKRKMKNVTDGSFVILTETPEPYWDNCKANGTKSVHFDLTVEILVFDQRKEGFPIFDHVLDSNHRAKDQ